MPSSTISSVHASWVCDGYACEVKCAWNTSWMPRTAGRQAVMSGMLGTYKTRAFAGGHSDSGELPNKDRRGTAGRPAELATAERVRVPGERYRRDRARADRPALFRRRRHEVPAHVRPAGDGVRGVGADAHR